MNKLILAVALTFALVAGAVPVTTLQPQLAAACPVSCDGPDCGPCGDAE
jgi:hypothetical protein